MHCFSAESLHFSALVCVCNESCCFIKLTTVLHENTLQTLSKFQVLHAKPGNKAIESPAPKTKLIHQFSATIFETDLSTSIFQLNEDGGRDTQIVFGEELCTVVLKKE